MNPPSELKHRRNADLVAHIQTHSAHTHISGRLPISVRTTAGDPRRDPATAELIKHP